MSSDLGPFTLGVEEEYQIIDPVTRELSSNAYMLLPKIQHVLGDSAQFELNLSQIEVNTPVCRTLAEVRHQLTRLRHAVIQEAERAGMCIAAAGTHPFSHWENQVITPKERYQELSKEYQQLALEPIFGYHVHVGLADTAVALQVMNQARVWLGTLLALSANSPFWLGHQTGYASYRTLLWSQWPTSGPPQFFHSLREYDELTKALVNVGIIEDPTKLYWDIRLSARFKTIEFRVADICLTVDEAVMLAGIIQALVQTCYTHIMDHKTQPITRPELVRAAHWHAARYGLGDALIDVEQQRKIPAHMHVEQLLTFIRPALESNGNWEEISELVRRTLKEGNGAIRQDAVYQRNANMSNLVDYIVEETRKGLI